MDMEQNNPVTGPVYVNGAEPGDILKVEILDIKNLGIGSSIYLPVAVPGASTVTAHL